MIPVIQQFFGINDTRPIEGFMSWQHLTFVSALVLIMALLAFLLGIRNRNRTPEEKNRVLIVAAILMDTLEIIKILFFCRNNPMHWIYELPLFLCSIQLITLPLAAFSKGRIREAALDFVSIFGLLGAVLGTYCAGNIYSSSPVLSFSCVVSGLTHCISGFAALYILIARMASMKKENMVITFAILLSFCAAAFIVNQIIDYNYMFLSQGDGTPYDILYNLFNGSKVLYPLSVVALFLIYITIFYRVYYAITKRKEIRAASCEKCA